MPKIQTVANGFRRMVTGWLCVHVRRIASTIAIESDLPFFLIESGSLQGVKMAGSIRRGEHTFSPFGMSIEPFCGPWVTERLQGWRIVKELLKSDALVLPSFRVQTMGKPREMSSSLAFPRRSPLNVRSTNMASVFGTFKLIRLFLHT